MVGPPGGLDAPDAPHPPDLFVPTPLGRVALRLSAGGGTPVLLLHDLHRGGADFTALLDGPLGRAHRLITPDLPGHGASDGLPDPARCPGLPAWADAVVAALEALDVDEVVVLGAAFGGHVALEMTTVFPGVLGAMLWGTPPLGHGPDAVARALRPAGVHAPVAWGEVLQGAAGRRVGGEVTRRGGVPASLLRSLLAGDYADQTAVAATWDGALAMVVDPDDPLLDPAYPGTLPYANLWGGACIAASGGGAPPFPDPSAATSALIGRFLADMERRRQGRADHPMLSFSG